MYSTIFSRKHCFSSIFPQFLIDINLYSSNYFFYVIVFFNQNVTFLTIFHIQCLFSFNNLNLWFGTQLRPSKRFSPIQLYLFGFFYFLMLYLLWSLTSSTFFLIILSISGLLLCALRREECCPVVRNTWKTMVAQTSS